MVAEQGFVPYDMKSSLVYITSYHGKCMKGYIENPFYQEKRFFDNLAQFSLLVEQLLDAISFPHRDTTVRDFYLMQQTPRVVPDVAAGEEKAIASFRLSVLFRQNSSWQGNIHWLETDEEVAFRSALELYLIIDKALESAQ